METPVATDAAPPEPVAAPPEPIQQAESISDHHATFSPEARKEADEERSVVETTLERQARERDQPTGRYRAQSQKARPEDVEQINALTKELRTKEAELRKAKPEAFDGSPRVIALRRQVKALEAELGELTPKETPQPQPPARREAPPSSPSAFTEAEPTLEQFSTAADPYAAYMRELARYDRRKEAFEDGIKRQHTEAAEGFNRKVTAHLTRMQAFAKQTPDFERVTASLMQQSMPKLLLEALIADDNGPQAVYYLAQHPELVDELFLLTDGKPVTDAHVATVQRRLAQHAQAATTGSAAVQRPAFIPPRPPNPVRTGPIKTADEPPGETASIADHAKYYGSKRR